MALLHDLSASNVAQTVESSCRPTCPNFNLGHVCQFLRLQERNHIQLDDLPAHRTKRWGVFEDNPDMREYKG